MSDIVARLREVQCEGEFDAATCDMAADTITALRAEVERLRVELADTNKAYIRRAEMAIPLEHDAAILRAENARLARDYETARNAHDALLLDNARLREALEEIADFHTWEDISNEECMRHLARYALKESSNG